MLPVLGFQRVILGVPMKFWLLSTAFLFTIFSASAFAANGRSLPRVDIKKVILTESAAKEAYLWGYPLVRFERTRKLMTTSPGIGHAPLNSFFHASRLAQPQDRGMTNPLPDALYSSAFLDLRNQPLVLLMPKITDRYYSLQFMDAFMTRIGTISSLTRGNSAGRFFISGPQYIGPVPGGFEHIRSSTNFVWAVGHIATTSPAQVRSSYNLLRKYELSTYNAYLGKERKVRPVVFSAKSGPTLDPRRIANAGISFFDELGNALKENEPSNMDSALLGRLRAADIGAGIKTSKRSSIREIREAYVRAIASAEMDMDRAIRKDLVQNRNGWNFVFSGSDSGDSATRKAALNKIYFGEGNPRESLHPVTYVDGNNLRLNGNSTYVIRFGKNQLPPVRSYWSLVPYGARERNLVENSLGRYSLGSYSPDLTFNRDGSLDIYISANEPLGRTQNWLPVPRENFYIMLNLYNPTDEVISGKYVLPRPQRSTLTPAISSNQ